MLTSLYTYTISNIFVIDGDTLKADINLGFNTFIKNKIIRLHGINAPETTKTIKGITNFKLSEGIKSKQYLASILLVQSSLVLFKSLEKEDSFGRCLGIIYFKNKDNVFINLNELLLTDGYVEKYKSK